MIICKLPCNRNRKIFYSEAGTVWKIGNNKKQGLWKMHFVASKKIRGLTKF